MLPGDYHPAVSRYAFPYADEGAHIIYSNFNQRSLSSKEHWILVLHFASNWGCDSVRQLAIRKLLPLISDVDKIVYGHRYSVSHWPLDGYQSVCSRNSWLTQEEGRRLGAEDVVRIGQVFFSTRVMPSDVPQEHIQTHVEQTFGLQRHIISAKLHTPIAVEAFSDTPAVTQIWEHKANAHNIEQHAIRPGSPIVERPLSPLEAHVPESQPELSSPSVLATSINVHCLKNHGLHPKTAHAMPTAKQSSFAVKEHTLLPIDELAAPSIVGYTSVPTEGSAILPIEEYIPPPVDVRVHPDVVECIPPAIEEHVPISTEESLSYAVMDYASVPIQEDVSPRELHSYMKAPVCSSPPATTKSTSKKGKKGKGRSSHAVSIATVPVLEVTTSKPDPEPCTPQPGMYEPMPASFAPGPSFPNSNSDPPVLGAFDEPNFAALPSSSLPEADDWFLPTPSRSRKENPLIMKSPMSAPPPPEVEDDQFHANRLQDLELISVPDSEVCITELTVTASLPIASSITTELKETVRSDLDILNAALIDASEKANAAAMGRAAAANAVREAEAHLFNVLEPVRKLEEVTKLWESERNALKRAKIGTQKRLEHRRVKDAQPAIKEAERVLTAAKESFEDSTSRALLAEEARAALLQ
jgi:hypothetical protein